MRRKERFLSTRTKKIVGMSDIAGIATINSGTTTVSVGAASVKSGSVVLITPQGYANTLTESGRSVMVGSIRAGGFNIFMAGSIAPAANLPVGYFVISRP